MPGSNDSLAMAMEETPQGLLHQSPTNVSAWTSTCPILPSSYQFVLIPVLYCIIFILGLVGNSIVIAVLCWQRNPKTVANIYILNLAVADLLR
ncbi:hypothetical protein JRQ81_007304 [Phrynocephalus forsythii]|uniref:G-protein coupled receptors family 1 profile domain-containing protein n=1 Tax=Phrynocephalus forsythii TaxID=171643 RepID=A0A9Q0XD69_9SAUR|nr:hypothetical protein JRQ81_007304 [Phrynocephalus forsythii]